MPLAYRKNKPTEGIHSKKLNTLPHSRTNRQPEASKLNSQISFVANTQEYGVSQQALSIYTHNVGCAIGKINKISNQLHLTLFDIIALQETKFHKGIKNEEIVTTAEFTIHRGDREDFRSRKSTGGGVITIIKSSLKPIRLQMPIDVKTKNDKTVIEHTISIIEVGSTKIAIVNVYITPYSQNQ